MFQKDHAALPSATHDEFARQEMCASLRKLFTTEIWPNNRKVYNEHLLPAFRAKNKRDPSTSREVAELMKTSFYNRCGSLLGRAIQEQQWEEVGQSIDRQLPELIEACKPKATDIGTVRDNPELEMPRYIEAVDIHLMPGNFHTERSADDVHAGALYDRGVYVFAFGGLGELNEGLGTTVAEAFQAQFPERKPRRILDIGCGCGFSTTPWKKLYPDAEVYGIDIGGPMVRYAHGRAEALGQAIHYSQQNGVATDFPDGYFDVVISVLVTHECTVPVIKQLFNECNRLLAPGGVMLHDGSRKTREMNDPFEQYIGTWFAYNANEPFTMAMRAVNYDQLIPEAGFKPDSIFEIQREAAYLKGQLPPVTLIGAIKE